MSKNSAKKIKSDLLKESDVWEKKRRVSGMKAAPKSVTDAIDQSLGLQMISIRLPITVIEQLKKKASSQGIGYQPYIRQLLTRHVNGDSEDSSHVWGAAESTGSNVEERLSLIEEELKVFRAKMKK